PIRGKDRYARSQTEKAFVCANLNHKGKRLIRRKLWNALFKPKADNSCTLITWISAGLTLNSEDSPCFTVSFTRVHLDGTFGFTDERNLSIRQYDASAGELGNCTHVVAYKQDRPPLPRRHRLHLSQALFLKLRVPNRQNFIHNQN